MKQKLAEAKKNCKKPDSNLNSLNQLEEALREAEHFSLPPTEVAEGHDIAEEMKNRIHEVCVGVFL